MATKEEYEKLERRVSVIETFLKIPKRILTLTSTTPIRIYIENKLFTTEIPSAALVEKYLMDDHRESIFVRILLHNVSDESGGNVVNSRSETYHYMVQRKLYSVCIYSKHPTEIVKDSPVMNTEITQNIKFFIDVGKEICLYFGYANSNKDLGNDHLFAEGKDNGVFFIINDKQHTKVKEYINKPETLSTITPATAKSIADGNIDIYKSKKLPNVQIVVIEKDNINSDVYKIVEVE